MTSVPCRLSSALCVTAALALGACVPPQRMCISAAECGALASCVAGRCVAQGFVPAIDASRRHLFTPVDLAYVRRGGDALTEGTATLGSARDPGALVLFRFAIQLPADAIVLEAFLILERASSVDSDPLPLVLHAARIADPWDGQRVSWGSQPRLEEIGAPLTRVLPSAGGLVRLDVREIVRRWRRRGDGEYGVAVIASGVSPTGIAFALTPTPGLHRDPLGPSSAAPGPADPASDLRAVFGPRLELYIR